MRHPEEFFRKSHEAAVVDPLNSNILKAHLPCAAREVFLRPDDSVYDMDAVRPVVEELVEEGGLTPGRKEGWLTTLRMPHRAVGIRAVGPGFNIYDSCGKVGELSGFRVLKEAFPGAVYLHRGRQYIVEELDIEAAKAFVREADVQYYTQALTSEEAEVVKVAGERRFEGFSVHEGALRMRHHVTGYEKKGLYDRQTIGRHELRMPEYVFNTEGLWIIIDDGLVEELGFSGFDTGGSLHAFEHAAISSIPLFALCDKNDIGGLSYQFYPRFRKSSVFIYDGHEGGVGLSRHVFGVLGDWLGATLRIIEECPCEEGCPSCVQDPLCGSRNEPLDKQGAAFLTGRLMGR
jgi:DEAD/DEAH box helicase domain-containing protein